ncbi:MAG TPA: hypothetical protein VFX49_10780, partial [Chloroflexota bacterium]|nr:hypothetical protein [Chloroflexota bacterium]
PDRSPTKTDNPEETNPMKPFFAAAATALLIAVPVLTFAADTPLATTAQLEAQGPDFSKCEAKEGRDHGECVSEIAMAYGDDHAQNDAANDADDSHGASAEAIGQDVAEAAQAMGDKCDAKEGREFGECISALAQKLGEIASSAPHGDSPTSTALVRGQSGR